MEDLAQVRPLVWLHLGQDVRGLGDVHVATEAVRQRDGQLVGADLRDRAPEAHAHAQRLRSVRISSRTSQR